MKMTRHYPGVTGGVSMGKGLAGIKTARKIFVISEENPRHLTEEEVDHIATCLADGDVESDLVRWYLRHAKMCEECRNKIESLPALMLREESIHTSEAPHPFDEITDRPDRKIVH